MRFRTLLLASLVGGFVSFTATCSEPDENTAKEFNLLEGVWAEARPKGDGRRNFVHFKDGKMGWRSTAYKDGDRLIGHSKGYEVKLDVSAKPKQITLTRGAKDNKQTLVGIYALDGDTLKIALGSGKDRPKTMDDKDARVIALKKVKY